MQLDPSRETAWKHLGYKRIGGHWDKPERVAAAKAEAEQQRKADRHWKPLLEKWREALASRDKTRREQAEKSLAEVTDPRAVPMIWAVFVSGGPQYHKMAVKLLGQIDSPGSSRALRALGAQESIGGGQAYGHPDAPATRSARFAPVLIALLRDPIKYEVRPVNGPGSQGQLFDQAEGRECQAALLAAGGAQCSADAGRSGCPSMPTVFPWSFVISGDYQMPRVISDELSRDTALSACLDLADNASRPISGVLNQAGVPAGLSQRHRCDHRRKTAVCRVFDLGPFQRAGIRASEAINRQVDIPVGQMMLDAQRSAQVAEQQLANDVQAIENYNAPIVDMNQRVRQVLTDSVGIDQGPEKSDWEKWLVDLSGYAFAAQARLSRRLSSSRFRSPINRRLFH